LRRQKFFVLEPPHHEAGVNPHGLGQGLYVPGVKPAAFHELFIRRRRNQGIGRKGVGLFLPLVI